MRKFTYVTLVAIALFVVFAPQPYIAARSSTSKFNALANFKHQGSCQLSSLDLYEPRSHVCHNRTSMLEAMSSGGRAGRDMPYVSRGCDMVWYTTRDVCEILGRFSQVMLIGDSMLRHIVGALNILIREDLGYGAVTDWNFNKEESRDCFCLNQFNVKTCSVQGIYKTADVLAHDPKSLVCPKLIPGWSTDLSIEQINRFPIPDEESTRLRASVRVSQSVVLPKPRAFILGQGLWNNLEPESSVHWLDYVLSIINRGADFQPPTLLVTPNAAGKDKPDRWLVTQGNKALARFEEAMADTANKLGVDHLGTWNMVSIVLGYQTVTLRL
ncbi:hypothetical protein TruAng_000123 [Truncatella angustata]|nr:hypothetical protein TruAng_000123 [Truncatella angustata]